MNSLPKFLPHKFAMDLDDPHLSIHHVGLNWREDIIFTLTPFLCEVRFQGSGIFESFPFEDEVGLGWSVFTDLVKVRDKIVERPLNLHRLLHKHKLGEYTPYVPEYISKAWAFRGSEYGGFELRKDNFTISVADKHISCNTDGRWKTLKHGDFERLYSSHEYA